MRDSSKDVASDRTADGKTCHERRCGGSRLRRGARQQGSRTTAWPFCGARHSRRQRRQPGCRRRQPATVPSASLRLWKVLVRLLQRRAPPAAIRIRPGPTGTRVLTYPHSQVCCPSSSRVASITRAYALYLSACARQAAIIAWSQCDLRSCSKCSRRSSSVSSNL